MSMKISKIRDDVIKSMCPRYLVSRHRVAALLNVKNYVLRGWREGKFRSIFLVELREIKRLTTSVPKLPYRITFS